MAYVVLPAAALDIAPADEHVGRISGCVKGVSPVVVCNHVPPGPRPKSEQRVLEMDGVRAREVADEDAAGGDLRHRVVVVKAEFRIRAHFRDDVHVGKRTERPLFRRAALVVVWTEIELVQGGAERSRKARGAVDRKSGAAACIREETPGIGRRGSAANESRVWIGRGDPPAEGACAEIT